MGSIGDFVSRRLLPFLITCGYNGPSRKAPGGPMDKINSVRNRDDVLRLLSAALRHEWAVSFEYVIHAYSMPKGKYFYDDPVLRQRTDARAQTIQLGIDEMYHALQLGIVLIQMGAEPSFGTDEVVRSPQIIANLRREQMTEEMV